jgi:hypothetical protein
MSSPRRCLEQGHIHPSKRKIGARRGLWLSRLLGWGWLALVAATWLFAAHVPASAANTLAPQTTQLWGGLGISFVNDPVAPVLAFSSEHEKPYVLIFGTVWTPDQRPASGIRVRIQKAGDKKPRWELISDSQGEFAQRVPAGTADYVVWAELKGHKGRAAETKVHVESDERVDIGLHLTE